MNLKIKTHSGGEYLVTVDEYNPDELNQKLNSNDLNTVKFGDIILSRIDVKSVVPIEESPIEEPPAEDDPIVDEEPTEE